MMFESDCQLCGGTGEVQITPYGHPESHSDVFGCPVCIQHYRDRIEQECDALTARITELEQKLTVAENDANRYRLIRDNQYVDLFTHSGECIISSTFRSAKEFDNAIDAEMTMEAMKKGGA